MHHAQSLLQAMCMAARQHGSMTARQHGSMAARQHGSMAAHEAAHGLWQVSVLTILLLRCCRGLSNNSFTGPLPRQWATFNSLKLL